MRGAKRSERSAVTVFRNLSGDTENFLRPDAIGGVRTTVLTRLPPPPGGSDPTAWNDTIQRFLLGRWPAAVGRFFQSASAGLGIA